jgi:uncharacterized membrane protein YuzA (DUF378 family)
MKEKLLIKKYTFFSLVTLVFGQISANITFIIVGFNTMTITQFGPFEKMVTNFVIVCMRRRKAMNN